VLRIQPIGVEQHLFAVPAQPRCQIADVIPASKIRVLGQDGAGIIRDGVLVRRVNRDDVGAGADQFGADAVGVIFAKRGFLLIERVLVVPVNATASIDP
jgi:hypothetical protein